MKIPWNPGTTPPDTDRYVVGLYKNRDPGAKGWDEVKFFRYEADGDDWCDLDCACQPPDVWIDLPEVPK